MQTKRLVHSLLVIAESITRLNLLMNNATLDIHIYLKFMGLILDFIPHKSTSRFTN